MAERVPQVLADPRSYPREAMILAALIAVFLLLLLLVGLIVSDAIQVAARRRALGVHRRPTTFFRRLFTVIGIVGLLLLGAALVPMIPSTGQACDTCHVLEPAVESWASSTHSGVSCYGCHARPGVLGAIQASAKGVAAQLGAARPASADSGSCLRCHRAIAREIVEVGSLRIQHSDMIAAGMDCFTCHPAVGHQQPGASGPATQTAIARPTQSAPTSARSRMDRCLSCHDGERAQAGCPVCHTADATDVTGEGWQFGVIPTSATCRGCHQASTTARCIRCHGLELPHPESFFGDHAKLSAGNPALCAKCHELAGTADSCQCHVDGQIHGKVSVWFTQHGEAARSVWPGGCKCHSDSFCLFCHDALPF